MFLRVSSALLLPIQTSPKQPWPSLSSSLRESRGISQASLASPWVWGLTVGQTAVSLWQSPSACSVKITTLHYTQQRHTQIHTPTWTSRVQRFKGNLFHASIHSILCGWIHVLPLTLMKYKWGDFYNTDTLSRVRREMNRVNRDLTSTLLMQALQS